MKKLINKIPDRYYLILIILILLIMVFCTFFTTNFSDVQKVKSYLSPQSFLHNIFNTLELAWFFPSLLLSYTVIAVFYYKKYLFIILSIICFFLHHYYMVLLLFPMFLYLHVRYAYKSNKLLQSINNIYKIIHILFLLYFNIYVFSSDFANSLKIPTGVVYPVIILSSIYTIILSYFIGKKTMFLYLFLSIIPILISYMTCKGCLNNKLILIFLINYIFIYYKQYLFAFIFLIYAKLQGEYLLFLIVIALVISLIFSDDKHKTPLTSKTVGKDEQV